MSITNTINVLDIIKQFPDFGKINRYKPITDGHINDTYVVEYLLDDGAVAKYDESEFRNQLLANTASTELKITLLSDLDLIWICSITGLINTFHKAQFI